MSGGTTAIALVGAAVSAYSSIQQGNAQRKQASYQSALAQQNANIAQQNAQMAEDEGRESKKIGYENMVKKRQEAAQIIGSQRAAQGASGTVVDVGGNLDANLDTAEKGELDALAMRDQGLFADYNKRIEGWNLRQQATGQQAQASMLTSQGKSINPWLNGGASLLGGLASAGSNYHIMTKGAKTVDPDRKGNQFFSDSQLKSFGGF